MRLPHVYIPHEVILHPLVAFAFEVIPRSLPPLLATSLLCRNNLGFFSRGGAQNTHCSSAATSPCRFTKLPFSLLCTPCPLRQSVPRQVSLLGSYMCVHTTYPALPGTRVPTPHPWIMTPSWTRMKYDVMTCVLSFCQRVRCWFKMVDGIWSETIMAAVSETTRLVSHRAPSSESLSEASQT